MKPNALKQRLHRHFITCSAVPGAAILLSGHQTADAAVLYIVPGSPIAIPNTFEGIYLNLETGAFDPAPSSVPGWDVNPYGTSSVLTWFSSAAGAAIGATAAAAGQMVSQAALTDFTTITWDVGYNMAGTPAIQAGGTHFVAFQFNDGASVLQNAWMEITTTGPNGFPAQINRWAFAPPGEPGFVVGVVPEAGTSALALLAAGAMGMRRRRAA